jgi:hypothetical protein
MSDFQILLNLGGMVIGDLQGCMQLGVATSYHIYRRSLWTT